MTRVDVVAKAIHGFCKHDGRHGWAVHRDEAQAALAAFNADAVDRATRSKAMDAERRKTADAIAERIAADSRHLRAVAHAKALPAPGRRIPRDDQPAPRGKRTTAHRATPLRAGITEITPDLLEQAGATTNRNNNERIASGI